MTVGLAILVKTPGHSPVKTRLAAAWGRLLAEEWHWRAARATAEVARATVVAGGIEPYWAVAEPSHEVAADWPEFPVLAQGTGDLGQRMGRVHAELLSRHQAAILIGADAPQVDVGQLLAAGRRINRPDPGWVLGPATDGGFWLFGGNRLVSPQAWSAVPYSRPDTAWRFRQAVAAAADWLLLDPLTDLDQASDLPAMRRQLAALHRPLPGQRDLLAWLQQFAPAATVTP